MDTLSTIGETETKDNHPSPKDLDEFLPWACFQFQIEVKVVVIRTVQDEYSSPFATDKKGRKPAAKTKEDKPIKSSKASTSSSNENLSKAKGLIGTRADEVILYIETIYDQSGNLVQLKFQRNQTVPRSILKVIALVIPYHQTLTSITIDRGLRYDGLYEIAKILSLSKISELVLDNVVILAANYYILLEGDHNLKYLSLARCMLTDKVVETLTKRLETSSLSILNLSSNRITDVGAILLGNVLRANRKLTYLNLAGNMISDKGAASILDCLIDFPLNATEIAEKKRNHMAYLKNKSYLISKFFNQLRAIEAEKQSSKKKISPTAPRKSKALPKEISVRASLSTPVLDDVLLEKAQMKADALLGPFIDPFSKDNSIVRNGITYCRGNNVLSYLNLAYNNLTYFTVKKLFDVVSVQECWNKVPRGLVNVCIEGNNIPETCYELTEIDFILQSGLATTRKISTMYRKRPTKTVLTK